MKSQISQIVIDSGHLKTVETNESIIIHVIVNICCDRWRCCQSTHHGWVEGDGGGGRERGRKGVATKGNGF